MSQLCQAEHFIFTFVFSTSLLASAKPTLIMIITEQTNGVIFNSLTTTEDQTEQQQQQLEERNIDVDQTALSPALVSLGVVRLPLELFSSPLCPVINIALHLHLQLHHPPGLKLYNPSQPVCVVMQSAWKLELRSSQTGVSSLQK